MKKIIYILLLISLTAYSQQIVQKGYFKTDTLQKRRTNGYRSLADAIKLWLETGQREITIKPYDSLVLYMPKLPALQKVKDYQDSVTVVKLTNTLHSCDSLNIQKYVAVFKDGTAGTIDTDTLDIKGFPTGKWRKLNLRYYYDVYGKDRYITGIYRLKPDPELETDFKLDTTYVFSRDSTKVKFRVISNKQNKITKLLLGTTATNIVEVPQDAGFNAYEASPGKFRHSRFITGLKPNTSYFYRVTVESKLGTQLTSRIVNFRTTR